MRTNCTACPLHKTRKKIVWPHGPTNTGLLAIAEAPGVEEDRRGRPLVGKAGKEYDNYLQCFAKVPRPEWRVTNLILCHPPSNRDPLPKEIAACNKYLEAELDLVQPVVITAMGRYAATRFGIHHSMEVVHGIPFRWQGDCIVVPVYHPAAGLHNTTFMAQIQYDFVTVGKVVRGEVVPEDWMDEYPEPIYREIRDGGENGHRWRKI